MLPLARRTRQRIRRARNVVLKKKNAARLVNRRPRRVLYFHQGARPVRKSVSVQGVKMMTSLSLMSACASARERGAGPRITLPSLLYWEPWHGHLNLFSALFQGTTQPRCVHTALMP